MANLLSDFRAWFWNKDFWLPSSVGSWEKFVSKDPDIYYPRYEDIFFQSILIGILFIGIRMLIERLILSRVALYLGIKPKVRRHLNSNPELEEVYQKNPTPDDATVQNLSKKTSLSERQIQRWFRIHRNNDMPSRMKKFVECGWQCLFYATSFFGGLWVLWDKPWLWSNKENWTNFPYQHVSNEVYYYYLFELGFYWNMVFSILHDHQRKDFKAMMVHHGATILLMLLSWICNVVRVGTLVIIAHDASDYWLLAAKMGIYTKRDTFADVLFVGFVLSWIGGRLIFYPFRVLYTVIFESMGTWDLPSFYVFLSLLLILMALNLMWTFMIGRIIVFKVLNKELKDTRSDTEESQEDEKTPTTNGHFCKQDVIPSENGLERQKHRA